MSMTTRSSKKRRPNDALTIGHQLEYGAKLPKDETNSRSPRDNKQMITGEQQKTKIADESSSSKPQHPTQEDNRDHEYVLTSDQPIFEGSGIGMRKFCTELLTVAETYELPMKACDDMLGLVRRMAPQGALRNFPERIEDFQMNKYSDVVGDISPSSDMADETCAPEQLLTHNQRQVKERTDTMAKVFGSLNKLSKDVNSLMRQYEDSTSSTPANSNQQIDSVSLVRPKRVMLRTTKQENERKRPKFFVKILDEFDNVVPICDLDKEALIRTVAIERDDPSTRIIYGDTDLTDRVMEKLDISLYLHNPSYCGRAVADTLFNPEFLARYHIVAEGQNNSRSNRKLLPPGLNQVFYDSLRKLGVSRIVEEDQLGWMEQARDAVNQRNRDIKIPGCRRKFFQNTDPIFK